MTTIRQELREGFLLEMAGIILSGAKNPLVNFEIQRRMNDVPGNLMELFYFPKDAIQIKDWHIRNPAERLSWVGTMLRYRVPHTALHFDEWGRLVIYAEGTTLAIDNPTPKTFKNNRNFWKGMDDLCLLIGVAFYLTVMQQGGETAFENPEDLYEV